MSIDGPVADTVDLSAIEDITVESLTATDTISITSGGTINVTGILTTRASSKTMTLTSTGGRIITDCLNTNRIHRESECTDDRY